MKLSQLRYFQAVCRCGSITKATEILHISQPSVSAAIRELENEFQVRLFSRESRSLRLTKEGQTLLYLADEVLEKADQLENAMKMLSQQKKTLHIGIPPMIASLILPRLYAMIKDDLRFTVTEGGREELLARLANRSIDFAFLPHSGPVLKDISSVPVFTEETVLCVSKDHPFANRRTVRFDELDDEKLIMFQSDYFHSRVITEKLREAESTARTVLETSQLSSILSMIPSGAVSGFLFRDIAESAEGIVPISLEPKIEVQISLFWNQDTLLTNDMRAFISRVRNMYA